MAITNSAIGSQYAPAQPGFIARLREDRAALRRVLMFGEGVATLISAYHARFADLYYNIGTIYDLLCFSFFYGAFLYYVKIRQSGRMPEVMEMAGILRPGGSGNGSSKISTCLIRTSFKGRPS